MHPQSSGSKVQRSKVQRLDNRRPMSEATLEPLNPEPLNPQSKEKRERLAAAPFLIESCALLEITSHFR
jgi:hypothetical protein